MTLGDANALVKDNEPQPWLGSTVLPPVDQDVLLYLCLTGGKYFRALQTRSGKPIPFCQALQAAEIEEASVFRFDNNEAYYVMLLEALVAGSIVVASHKNGFAGVAFDAFLSALLYELGIFDSAEVAIKPSVPGFTVPFLGPPNVQWPRFLPPELNLGTLKVIQRSDGKFDMSFADVKYSVDCKDYLSLNEVKNLLSWIPKSSMIHLVVCNSLQDSCFTDGSFDAFKESSSLESVGVYRIGKATGPGLVEIPGVENR